MLDAPPKNPSFKAAQLIKQFEGCSLTPYLCPAGKWTIGYGSTYLTDGTRVTKDTPEITPEQADALLKNVVADLQMPIWRLVKVKLTPGQEAALLSFTYNIGLTAFSNSTLLKKLNAGDYDGAANQLLLWVHAGGEVLRGLTRRREAERALFLGL